MPAFTFHVWQVPGLNEVILIGVYEDSIFQTFLKDCKREFPNISVSCVYSFFSTLASCSRSRSGPAGVDRCGVWMSKALKGAMVVEQLRRSVQT